MKTLRSIAATTLALVLAAVPDQAERYPAPEKKRKAKRAASVKPFRHSPNKPKKLFKGHRP